MFTIDPALDVFSCLGLGLVAMLGGGIGLLRNRRIVRPGWILPATLAVLTGVPGVTFAMTSQPAYSTVGLLTLAGFWAAVVVFRSTLFLSVTRRLAQIVQGSLIPSLSLAALGAGLIAWQVYVLDVNLDREIRESDDHLLSLSPLDLQPIPGLVKVTDLGRQVPLFDASSEDAATEAEESEYIRSLKLENHLMRTGASDPHYNCHGWVFASGQGWIRGQFVEQILADNRYAPVSQPAVGDLAIFRTPSGDVAHSAVVRTVLENGQVLLESKWGKIGRYLHTSEDHAYSLLKRTYYHTQRGNHELLGAPAQSLRPGS